MFTNNTVRRLAFSITLIGGFALAGPTFANSDPTETESAQRINAANQLLREGELDQAIAVYGDVDAIESNRDELNYNLAVAHYRKNDLQAAASLFDEAAGSSNTSIAARSRFNLGNCRYATALETATQDKAAAIEKLREAISHYRGSLRGMPDNEDARANIELAAELIRKLEEEQKQQEQDQQEQNQDQQNQDQQNQDQQNQDGQQQQEQQSNPSQNSKSEDSKSEDSKSEDSKSEDSESEDSESNPSQEQQDAADSDDSNSDESGESEPEQDDSENNSEEDQTQNPDQQTASQQDSASDQPENQNQRQNSQSSAAQPTDEQSGVEEETGDSQPVPTGQLTAADQQDADEELDGSVAMTDPNAKDELMTQEEALKMLQAVRDRDMLRRWQQQQRERSRHIPVDRNW